MSSTQFNAAWNGIEQSWKNGRLAHAWLLQGSPHGAALRFAENMLALVFNRHPQIKTRAHPDIVWMEPESKSRRIGIDEIRDNLIRPLSQTSFAGGWKAGVLFEADRMTPEASNAFLKTLEEPTPKTLLLLLTDEPQALPPTIVSRCQRIALTGDEAEQQDWYPVLLETLRALPPANSLQADLFAAKLGALLDTYREQFEAGEEANLPEELAGKERKELRDARTGARVVEMRTGMLRIMLRWQRDVLLLALGQDESALHFPEEKDTIERQALRCTRAGALRNVAAVEEMNRQFDRNLPAGLVFSGFFTQMVLR